MRAQGGDGHHPLVQSDVERAPGQQHIVRRREPVRRFVGPGERIVLLTPAAALLVWRRFTDARSDGPAADMLLLLPEKTDDLGGMFRMGQVAGGEAVHLRRDQDGRMVRRSHPGYCLGVIDRA